MKTQIIVLLSLSITIGMMGSAYANEQYPGINDRQFKQLFGGSIESDEERYTAEMINDIYLYWDDRDDLLSSDVIELWDAVDPEVIGHYSFEEGIQISINKELSGNFTELADLIVERYPDASYHLREAPFFDFFDGEDDWTLTDYNDDDSDTQGMRGSIGKAFDRNKVSTIPIPDNSKRLVELSSIDIPHYANVESMTITVVITHEDHDELNIYLKKSDDTIVKLSARQRGIDDGQHTYISTGSDKLSSFIGSELSGPLKLMIGDYRRGDTGSLISWNVEITGMQYTDHVITPPTDIIPESTSIWDSINGWLQDIYRQHFADTNCSNSTDNCMPQEAGMLYTVMRESTDIGPKRGTIGLGGVQTTDGDYGFLIAGHSLLYEKTGDVIYHDANSNSKENMLGVVTVNNGDNGNILGSDVAFVKYPVQCKDHDNLSNICATNGDPFVTVIPMKIFKDRRTSYDVTGNTTDLTVNQQVFIKGIRTGETTANLKFATVTETELTVDKSSYFFILKNANINFGDSGGPVYVRGDGNNVSIIGTVSARDQNTPSTVYVVPWDKIQSDLGLKPIS